MLDYADPDIVYLSRKRGGWFHVERWRTSDGGASWEVLPITSGARHHVRPVIPRGNQGNGSIQVLFMTGRYNSYTNYQTDVALMNKSLSS